jgi:hypothetical protein
LERNAPERLRNWVISINDTEKHSSANCEIFVANVEVDAQNMSNIKKMGITAKKGNRFKITA